MTAIIWLLSLAFATTLVTSLAYRSFSSAR